MVRRGAGGAGKDVQGRANPGGGEDKRAVMRTGIYALHVTRITIGSTTQQCAVSPSTTGKNKAGKERTERESIYEGCTATEKVPKPVSDKQKGIHVRKAGKRQQLSRHLSAPFASLSKNVDDDDHSNNNNNNNSQDEEGRSPLSVVQEAEVGGDGLGHHFEVRLEAAKDARERAVHACIHSFGHPTIEGTTKSVQITRKAPEKARKPPGGRGTIQVVSTPAVARQEYGCGNSVGDKLERGQSVYLEPH